ncbi:hypothetical protein FQ185_26490 [Pseudomonas sp. ANT_H12B]|nr:hypothetical protein [Pseudomonas sp. ANT_H12B]KAA0959314.1 hypothetical protein FQ185_26490 [Pseudomonas sp. ANT_H12B]
MKRLALLLSLGLSLSVHAAPMRWADIRDGRLYLQPDRPDTLTVRWVPAWQADANEERLYLLDGRGKLEDERLIAASESRGSQSWPLAPSAARYQLEIPGYSFRRYTVEHAVLAGKFHGGVGALQAQRVGDGRKLSLALKPYQAYWQFDTVPQRHVASTRDDRFEVDVLAMTEDVKRSLLGVNKGTRLQRVDLTGARCPLAKGSLRYFGADNRTRDAPFSCQDGRVSFELPGRTLFNLSWSAS